MEFHKLNRKEKYAHCMFNSLTLNPNDHGLELKQYEAVTRI
jgi:hypothetical protein